MAATVNQFVEAMLRGLQRLLKMNRADALATVPDRPNYNSQALGSFSDFLAFHGGVNATNVKESGRRGGTSLDMYRTALGKTDRTVQTLAFVLDLMEVYFRARVEASSSRSDNLPASLGDLLGGFVEKSYRHDMGMMANLGANIRYAQHHMVQEGIFESGFEIHVPELQACHQHVAAENQITVAAAVTSGPVVGNQLVAESKQVPQEIRQPLLAGA